MEFKKELPQDLNIYGFTNDFKEIKSDLKKSGKLSPIIKLRRLSKTLTLTYRIKRMTE